MHQTVGTTTYFDAVSTRKVVHSGFESSKLDPDGQRQSVVDAVNQTSQARVAMLADVNELGFAVQAGRVSHLTGHRYRSTVNPDVQRLVRHDVILYRVHADDVMRRST